MRIWIDIDWDEGIDITPELVSNILNEKYPRHNVNVKYHECPVKERKVTGAIARILTGRNSYTAYLKKYNDYCECGHRRGYHDDIGCNDTMPNGDPCECGVCVKFEGLKT